MDKKTREELIHEYERVKEMAKRFSHWEALDKFTLQMIQQVALPSPRFSFDSEGTPIPYHE